MSDFIVYLLQSILIIFRWMAPQEEAYRDACRPRLAPWIPASLSTFDSPPLLEQIITALERHLYLTLLVFSSLSWVNSFYSYQFSSDLAMTSTVGALLLQHPTNPVEETGQSSSTNKAWAQSYHPIKNYIVHTISREGVWYADYDTAFFPLYHDDEVRLQLPANPPNERAWRLETESDAELWFHTEISNIVLAGWSRYPTIVQNSHIKALSGRNNPEEVDATYAYRSEVEQVPLVIGEMKRRMITTRVWQKGETLSGPQQRLSRELRGYAHKYHCPQVFCFDGQVLLLLQFCATTRREIADENCNVDCWVIPRGCGIPLRMAFYRLLVQGLRRFQGMRAVAEFSCSLRQFYNGRPLWDVPGTRQYTSTPPYDYRRSVDGATGCLIWVNSEGTDFFAESTAIWTLDS
ncbi:uncharacterized protein UV8b_07661 [Ustilaginoidea virens]|uniref:Uncharacterized protein n=1 Tax=Ustilaginoidea virens TaxID=1159556 RepID=A0A8E5HXF8_USTVR|nr:uncharacterized protein UV8b_07661 [Ustilaginoidea virens]QUC23420.1 hypothetical protein UV8b_07661 [Ustilaginoidea virens]